MALVALLLTLGAVELVFRLFVAVTPVPYYFWDPVLGPRPVPDKAGRNVSGDHINVAFRFNAQGWNNPLDYQIERPAGGCRVALVGDSFVEAMQVEPSESMFAVAARHMARDDRPAEWYSFGVSGWGTTQQLEVIRHYVLDYRPDLVIVLFVENDPFDSSPYLVPIEPYMPTYALDASGGLVLQPATYWERSPLKKLLVQSAAVRYFYIQRGLSWRRRHATNVAEGVQIREAVLSGDTQRLASVEQLSLDERRQKTWELIEATLAAIRDHCRHHGARLAVAFRGSMRQIESARSDAPYNPPPREEDPYCLGPRADQMGREWLEPITARLEIAYLDLTGPLREMVSQSGQSHIFPDDSHYNAAAHAAVGAALAHWAEQLLDETADQRER